MFKSRRILIEKGDDGHARVVVLYRQVAQSDKLLDYVSLPSKSSFLHISYNGRVPFVCCVYTYRLLSTCSRGSHHKLLPATISPDSPGPSWNPPTCRFCNLLEHSMIMSLGNSELELYKHLHRFSSSQWDWIPERDDSKGGAIDCFDLTTFNTLSL